VRPILVLSALACSLNAGCNDAPSQKTAPAQRVEPRDTLSREPLAALPDPPSVDPKLVALGRQLFHEKRLSTDNSVACSTCHDLARGGVDGKPHSSGVRGQLGGVNAPTVYNSGLNFVQFWDGRAKDLEEQAGGPVTNPLEMGTSWEQVLPKLRADSSYVKAFAEAFGDGISADNVKHAIASFERTLITKNSPFDRWLAGDTNALSAEQKAGYELFKGIGCIACHQGHNVGGNMFQRFGVFGDYFKDRGNVTEADYGRYNVTHNESDRFVFRVPSLRNVARTAPYFHDGSTATLPQAVGVMAKYQLGRSLSDEQVSELVAFLTSLSGDLPATAEAH
jgi:cytochrome c peroxidase